MKRRSIHFDERCEQLAAVFLADIEGADADDVLQLALSIQSACEDHCEAVEERIAAFTTGIANTSRGETT